MSVRTKILLATVPVAMLVVAAFSALLLSNLLESNLQNSRHLAELALQQTKERLLLRLEQSSKDGVATRDGWAAAIADDPRIASYLVNSLAQAPSLVEINVAGEDGRILVSSTESMAGQTLRNRPTLYQLLALGPIDRLRAIQARRDDYELAVPIGVLNDPRPILRIQVLVSMTLVSELLREGLRWIAGATLAALFVSLILVSLLARFVASNVRRIEADIDRIRQGESVPAPGPRAASPEFAAVQSKLSLLGAEVRTAADFRSRVSAALDRLEEGILLFDSRGRLVLSGGAASRLLGRSLDVFTASETPLDPLLRRVLETRQSIAAQRIEWLGPQSATPLLADADPVGDSHVLVRLRDPEVRHQLESQVELLSRLDAINRLTGGVAHEIKNPLNSIAARLALLETMVDPDSAEAQEEIRIINEEVLRLDRVVRTFLDFTRPVELVTKEFDIVELATDVTLVVRADAARRNVTVACRAEPEHIPMWGDADLLRQALINLSVNALDAMPGGGSLTLAIVRLSGAVQLTVADTGSGIPPQAREKIFQLYFTTKKNGNGIGLAMVYRAVQLHGGKIEVESESGQGTKFTLTLPVLART